MDEKPKRRWFRFGLRSLFVAVTLAACGIPATQVIEAHYGIAQARRKLKQMQDEMAMKDARSISYGNRYIKTEGTVLIFSDPSMSTSPKNEDVP